MLLPLQPPPQKSVDFVNKVEGSPDNITQRLEAMEQRGAVRDAAAVDTLRGMMRMLLNQHGPTEATPQIPPPEGRTSMA